jgi:hypothetical protein
MCSTYDNRNIVLIQLWLTVLLFIRFLAHHNGMSQHKAIHLIMYKISVVSYTCSSTYTEDDKYVFFKNGVHKMTPIKPVRPYYAHKRGQNKHKIPHRIFLCVPFTALSVFQTEQNG